MKKFQLVVLAILFWVTACQQQPTTQKAVVADPPSLETAAVLQPNEPTSVSPKPVLTPDMQDFLKEVDLSPLWRTANSQDDNPLHNGFFGKNHFRIEFVFTSIKRDTINPARFHVTGKNRYKKTITPFTGVIQIKQLQNQQPEDAASEELVPASYVATGEFQFVEHSNTSADGIFQGATVLDFQANEQGKLEREYSLGGKYGAAGSGYIFKGIWTNKLSGEKKSVLLADDFLGVANTVISDFSIGERDISINPKYAKLGWNEYWENDEWWAEPGTVTAQSTPADSL